MADANHKDDAASIGRELAKLREEAGLTQKEAANLLGIAGENTISRWENGLREPTGDLYRRAVTLYRMRVAERQAVYVPRGTSPSAERIRSFEREMIRLGADDFESDHVRERAAAFLEAIHSQGGTNEEEELETYLEFSLRPWVVKRIEQRKRRAKK